ncbi:MAG: threonylcarbamoyl-AMP synthase [Gammaproteobacteria bacterium]|nr:threonylcarbamoyl-AMP synthase [Gammaproteobacteria bacterium]
MKRVVDEAVACLRRGELVVLPTESVYGLAADPFNVAARARWVALKGRSQQQPFTIHIADQDEVSDWVTTIPPAATKLMAAFWPGPLTLILPTAKTQQPQSSQDGTVGLRCIDHPLTRAVIRALGHGLMMSSANRTRQPPPVTAVEAQQQLGEEVALVVDGGRCQAARSSTILSLATPQPQLLREGPISRQQIELTLQGKVIMLE